MISADKGEGMNVRIAHLTGKPTSAVHECVVSRVAVLAEKNEMLVSWRAW